MSKQIVGTSQDPTQQVNRAKGQTATKTPPSCRAWLLLASSPCLQLHDLHTGFVPLNVYRFFLNFVPVSFLAKWGQERSWGSSLPLWFKKPSLI